MMEFFFYNISNTFVRAAAGISSMLTGQFALFLLVAISILFSLSPKNIPRFSINNFASWAVIALPTIISIVFIFAREHYLIVLSTLTILLFATIARNLKLRDSFPVAVMVNISTIFFVPPLRESVKRPFTDTVVALAKIRPFGNLLEMDGGWCYFAPHVCRPIFALEVKTADMVDYLEEGHVNGIMVSSALMAWAEQNNQPALVELMKNGSPEWDKRALSDEFSLMIRNKIDREGLDNVFTSNIMSFVGIVHVGRAPSTVQKKDGKTILVHPGQNDATVIRLDAGRFAALSGCGAVMVTLKQDDRVPPEALVRGGAVFGVHATQDGQTLAETVISDGKEVQFTVESGSAEVEISVDDHGNPDTDWANIVLSPIRCGQAIQ